MKSSRVFVILMLTVTATAVRAEAARITGHVVGASGSTLAGARVFLEAGREAPLVEAAVDAQGGFEFKDVGPGLCGVFALANGAAFGGASVTLSSSDALQDVAIRLAAPATLSGLVVDDKGKPVGGARVARVALLGESKVSIPFSKLETLGIAVPITSARGAFAIPNLPEGGTAALILTHPNYAQEGTSGCRVAESALTVTLTPGVEVSGNVRNRGSNAAVPQASVFIKNAQPPHDTAEARAGADGAFSLRLKPGAYLLQAIGDDLRSAGWQSLTVRGDAPMQGLTVLVAGMGKLRGAVREAASGAPVAGANVMLTLQGSTAAVAPVGADGQYELEATEGEAVVTLQPPSGFAPPQQNAYKVTVKASETVEMPTFWLARPPGIRLETIDDTGAPAPGAVVTLLRPAQFGWRVTDAQGQASLALAAASGGKVIGLAEDPARPLAALFAADPNATEPAKVQLLPLASVRGVIQDEKGRPLSGAVVTGQLALPGEPDALTVWRTVSGEDGSFVWESIVPGAPLLILAASGAATGVSGRLEFQPGATVDAGTITLTGVAQPKPSLRGKHLDWSTHSLISGPAPAQTKRPALIVYAAPEEVLMLTEGLDAAAKAVGLSDMTIAVLTTGAYPGGNAPLPILEGTAPGVATTYLVNAEGRVTLETFGFPSLRALAAVRGKK